MATLTHHFDLAPADIAIPSGAHRLHRRLLGGEAGGIALVARSSARFAVGDFAFGVHALAEALAGARAGECALDALDLDQVDPGAENAHLGAILDGARGRRKRR
jgi:hypothetical protein